MDKRLRAMLLKAMDSEKIRYSIFQIIDEAVKSSLGVRYTLGEVMPLAKLLSSVLHSKGISAIPDDALAEIEKSIKGKAASIKACRQKEFFDEFYRAMVIFANEIFDLED